jgi:hypothetical protein
MKADPRVIYLEPGAGGPEGRLWCQDDVWTRDPNYHGQQASRYVLTAAMLCVRCGTEYAGGDRCKCGCGFFRAVP